MDQKKSKMIGDHFAITKLLTGMPVIAKKTMIQQFLQPILKENMPHFKFLHSKIDAQNKNLSIVNVECIVYRIANDRPSNRLHILQNEHNQGCDGKRSDRKQIKFVNFDDHLIHCSVIQTGNTGKDGIIQMFSQ